MAKLKDDNIRWILSLDAKGVQGELMQVSSETEKLKKNNAELSKEMKAVEKQMKSAAAEMERLEKAGKTTSSAYKEAQGTFESAKNELEDYRLKIVANNQTIAESAKKFDELEKSLSVNEMTMNQLRQRAAELQKQLDSTSESADPKAFEAIQKELQKVDKRMFEVGVAGKGMVAQFASMNHPIGTAAKAVQGLSQVLTVLKAHPVIAVISLIVSLFMALQRIVKENEEAFNTLNRILAPVKEALAWIFDLLMQALNFLLKLIEEGIKRLTKWLESWPLIGKWMKQINEESEKAIELERKKQELQEQQRKNIVAIAKEEQKIAELRAKVAERDKYNAKERISLLEEAKDLELGILELKRNELQTELEILEATNAKTKGTSEYKDQLAQVLAALYRINTEYADKERALNRGIASARIEDQREMAAAAKEALDQRLKNEENALNQQINQLKQARLQGLTTEKEYNKQVDKLTIESLHRKINIRGQEKDKILQLEAQILDAEYKLQTENDRDLIDALRKKMENQLSIIEAGKNERLERLQEQEEDQKLYALRAAEIESEAAMARLDIMREFNETIQQAEFENAQIRLDAIEQSGKDILEAETQNLKKQEQLRKLFARTNADFYRQFNIKTWEQRKNDEMQLLKRYRDEELIDEETFQIARLALEKKYEDEKLRVRQSYGIARLADFYASELDLLREQHEKGLLSVEEYERAKLQIKLRYAQEYTSVVEQLSTEASGMVANLMAAETANIEKRYDAEIAAAGNNKKEVERLEREKAQKKLDVEKKYADVQFAITAAQIVASTAMAIMQAFAQLGPIAGAIAGALVGVAGVAQLVVANAQRQKVKQMTLAGGGDSAAQKTGQITLKQGYAEGGANMGDHTDGGYTGDGQRYEVAGWVPYHNGEYFVAVPEMKNPEVQNHIRAIDTIRRRRTSRNPLPAGFVEGGSNLPADFSGTGGEDRETNQKLLALLDGLISGQIAFKTNYGVTEYQAAEREKLRDESNFTR